MRATLSVQSGASNRQGIPHAGEPEPGEMRVVARGKLGHAMMPQCQPQPCVKDHATANGRLGGKPPDLGHHGGSITGIINEPPRRMLTKGLNNGSRLRRIKRAFEDGRIAEQHVKFDQHQFADGDGVGRDRQRGEEAASIVMFRAIPVQRIEEKIGVERDNGC